MFQVFHPPKFSLKIWVGKRFNFQEKGITLVEIIIAILIVTLFSAILISDFPKILRQFALSRAAYKLAQDIRKTQDLGLSGVQITDEGGQPIGVKGYGVYINLINDNKKYIIYADRGDNFNRKYDNNMQLCSQGTSPYSDCVLEIVDVGNDNPDLFIKEIKNVDIDFTSINFTPPGPIIDIENLCQLCSDEPEVGIVLGLSSDSSATRTIWVNTSGLIRVE